MLKRLKYLVAEGFLILDCRRNRSWTPEGTHVEESLTGWVKYGHPDGGLVKTETFDVETDVEFEAVKEFLRICCDDPKS